MVVITGVIDPSFCEFLTFCVLPVLSLWGIDLVYLTPTSTRYLGRLEPTERYGTLPSKRRVEIMDVVLNSRFLELVYVLR